ncbi:MAG: hypothetical protein Q8P59_03145, partial [Dehalococcoidia bacterium]|nr:hypothetical protein [Dehalococcoidia bacterium]
MSTRKKYLLILAVSVVLLLAISACAPAAPPATPTPTAKPAGVAATPSQQAAATPTAPTATPVPVRVRFGSPGLLTDAGVYIAMDKGYFKEQGIN